MCLKYEIINNSIKIIYFLTWLHSKIYANCGMEIKSKERKKMKMFEKIIVTKHFIERYCQRILNISDHMEFQEVKDLVLEDMVERMTIIEKECFEIFCHSGTVKLPLGQTSQLIVEDNTLITVY